jgi:hypothetical protein
LVQKIGPVTAQNSPRIFKDSADILDSEFSPISSDGQMLFLANMASKMNAKSALGSRIAEVHNGSSLFTGDAGQGESNIRRWLIENDWLEAIVALPLNLFYNTSKTGNSATELPGPSTLSTCSRPPEELLKIRMCPDSTTSRPKQGSPSPKTISSAA